MLMSYFIEMFDYSPLIWHQAAAHLVLNEKMYYATELLDKRCPVEEKHETDFKHINNKKPNKFKRKNFFMLDISLNILNKITNSKIYIFIPRKGLVIISTQCGTRIVIQVWSSRVEINWPAQKPDNVGKIDISFKWIFTTYLRRPCKSRLGARSIAQDYLDVNGFVGPTSCMPL